MANSRCKGISAWKIDLFYELLSVYSNFHDWALVGDSSLLSWTTALERNHDRFEVERSTNGVVFERVGVVRGQGNKDDLQYYTFLDAPLPGINYYRLLLRIDDYTCAMYGNGFPCYSHNLLPAKNAGRQL